MRRWQYLIRKKVLPFELTDIDLPPHHFGFKKEWEGRMPPDVYKKLSYSTVAGYDEKMGCQLLTVTMAPKDYA